MYGVQACFLQGFYCRGKMPELCGIIGSKTVVKDWGKWDKM